MLQMSEIWSLRRDVESLLRYQSWQSWEMVTKLQNTSLLPLVYGQVHRAGNMFSLIFKIFMAQLKLLRVVHQALRES